MSVEWVDFSPDGKQVVSASKDQTTRLWDVPTGRSIRVLTGHESWVYCAVFTPDGKKLISAGRDQTIRYWDVGSGKEIRQFIRPTYQRVSNAGKWATDFLLVSPSPNCQYLVVAGSNHGLLLFNATTGEGIRPFRGTSQLSTPKTQAVI